MGGIPWRPRDIGIKLARYLTGSYPLLPAGHPNVITNPDATVTVPTVNGRRTAVVQPDTAQSTLTDPMGNRTVINYKIIPQSPTDPIAERRDELISQQCGMWNTCGAHLQSTATRFTDQMHAKPLDSSIFLTVDTGDTDVFGGNAALVSVGPNKLFVTAAHCTQNEYMINTTPSGARAILRVPAEESSTFGYADVFVQRVDTAAFCNSISTTCPAVGYMRSFYVGENGEMCYKILKGEMYWSQAIAAGTCLHSISNRDGDSGSAIYDSPDADARVTWVVISCPARKPWGCLSKQVTYWKPLSD